MRKKIYHMDISVTLKSAKANNSYTGWYVTTIKPEDLRSEFLKSFRGDKKLFTDIIFTGKQGRASAILKSKLTEVYLEVIEWKEVGETQT